MSIVVAAFLEVIEATLPVLALILFFQLVILRRVPPNIRAMMVGVGMAMSGFFLFILGAKISLIPMGMRIGEFLAGVDATVVVIVALFLGVTVIFAEPAVRILARQIEEVSAGSLRKRFVTPTVALGVGFAFVFAVLRVMNDFSLAWILVPGYLIVLSLTLLAPRSLVPVAFDAGAVATGPVAVNFLLPMTTGMAVALWGEDAGMLGFGIVGIIAMCPIILMLLLGIALDWRQGNDR